MGKKKETNKKLHKVCNLCYLFKLVNLVTCNCPQGEVTCN